MKKLVTGSAEYSGGTNSRDRSKTWVEAESLNICNLKSVRG